LIDTKNTKKFLRFASAAAFLLFLLLPSTSFAKMVGPYDGQVTDSRTGEPMQKASVLICWEKGFQFITHHSELVKAVLVYTDSQGRYRVPRQFLNIGQNWWLERTVIIIYQPGYQAYIKNRWWREAPTFPHKGNIVKLERIPPGFNHKKHYDRITDDLRGLDDGSFERVDSMTGRSLPFRKIIEQNAVRIELWEFLRRIQWEEERKGVK
jgi:hypothetical protein